MEANRHCASIYCTKQALNNIFCGQSLECKKLFELSHKYCFKMNKYGQLDTLNAQEQENLLNEIKIEINDESMPKDIIPLEEE